VPQQGDFGFWPANDRVGVKRGPYRKKEFGVITKELLAEVFDEKMLTASLLTHSNNDQEAFMAALVLRALSTVRKELEGKIS
jgi:hypothetical protein